MTKDIIDDIHMTKNKRVRYKIKKRKNNVVCSLLHEHHPVFVNIIDFHGTWYWKCYLPKYFIFRFDQSTWNDIGAMMSTTFANGWNFVHCRLTVITIFIFIILLAIRIWFFGIFILFFFFFLVCWYYLVNDIKRTFLQLSQYRLTLNIR